MQTTSNAAVKAEKPAEKVIEKRRALGRGLDSLLPGPRAVPPNSAASAQTAHKDGATEGAMDEAGRTGTPAVLPELSGGAVVDLHAAAARGSEGQPVVEVAIDLIDHNPHQTRTFFDEEFMEELANSIRVQGVLQPVVVRPEGNNGRYILILGERRLRASKLAGKTTIPAIVKRVSEQQAAEMTIVENLQRQDLDCLEQAAAFAHLSREFSLTQEQIGKRVGVSRETVSNYLRLLKLPIQVQTFLNRGDLTYSHARELLVLTDDAQILKLAELAVKKKMSVLQLEALVMDVELPRQPDEDKPSGGARWVDPNVRAAQRNLEMILGMRVRIRDRKGKGKITIEYNTIEDYERVVGMLKGRSQ